MKKQILFPCVLVVSMFLFSGCDDGSGKKAPSLSLEEVENAYYDLFCQKIESCEYNAFFSILIHDHQDCVDFLDSQKGDDVGVDDLVAAAQAGVLTYDGEAAYACLDAMRELSCAAFGKAEPPACRDAFVGAVADGGDCHLNEECLSGYCDTSSQCPGVCRPAVPANGNCETSEECGFGAKCVLGKCAVFTAPIAAGADCDPDEDWCDTGLFCHPDSQKCTARLAIGANCDDIHPMECAQGSLCLGIGQDQKKCVALTVVETAGEVCDYNAGKICAAYNDLACAIDDFQAFTGTCQVSKKLGEVCFDSTARVLTLCDPTADLYCDLSGGFQTDGRCTAKKPGGQACNDGEQCLSGVCDQNVCADEEPICTF